MLKYLRMDLYRLVRGKMLWVMLSIMLIMSVFMTFMMWWSTTPEFASFVNEQAGVQQPQDASASVGMPVGATGAALDGLNGTVIDDFTQNQANMWLSGGALALLVSIVCALFFAVDFTSGYVKNLPSSRRDRLAYYGEKLVFVVLLSAAFLAFAVVTFELSRIVAGLTYAHVGTVGEIAVWLGLSLLIVSMYGAFAAAATWLTQSKAVGLAVAITAGSGMVGGLAVTILQGLASLWEPFGKAMEWMPFYSYQLLRQGGEALMASPGDIGHVLISCGVALVACIVVALGVCARKDV